MTAACQCSSEDIGMAHNTGNRLGCVIPAAGPGRAGILSGSPDCRQEEDQPARPAPIRVAIHHPVPLRVRVTITWVQAASCHPPGSLWALVGSATLDSTKPPA